MINLCNQVSLDNPVNHYVYINSMSTILGIQLIVYQRGILPTYSSAFQALLVAANDHQQSDWRRRGCADI